MPLPEIETPTQVDTRLSGFSDLSLQRYADELDKSSYSKSWAALSTDQKEAMRAANMLHGRKHQRELEANRTAEMKRHETEHEAQAIAEREAFKQQQKQFFSGTNTEFESLFPQIWEKELLHRFETKQQENEVFLRRSVHNRIG